MQCPQCDHFNASEKKFCTECGKALTQKTCPQGHSIPASLSECPYCPKPRQGTVVEPSVQSGPVAGGRKGTMVVSPEALASSGVVSTGASNPGVAAPGSGQSRRGRTMVVSADEQEASLSASRVGTSGGMMTNVGASPLAGFLVSFSTDENGIFWPLRYGRTSIGCAEDNEIVLASPEVSGQHAFINVRKGKDGPKIWLSDNNSMNGTMLDGEDIFNERPDLVTDSVVKIGAVEMRLVLL